MITRFSIYGFLKNQRYFEPFLILFFLEKGLTFTQIGILVGFRELFINIFELTSGALADLYGRRKSMIFSFLTYIISFIVFSLALNYWHFFIAMVFFAMGEAFRTGTHKAMIFTWLRMEGRINEKVRIYGYTRSWAKIGSAVSIVFATLFVLLSNGYSTIFYFTIIPYLIGLINFITYPKELDGNIDKKIKMSDTLKLLSNALIKSVKLKNLRRLIFESMAFEGVFKAVKDYIQPIMKSLVLGIPLLLSIDETGRSAVIIGIVYIILYLLSAAASRKSYIFTKKAGGEERGSHLLWIFNLIIYISDIFD